MAKTLTKSDAVYRAIPRAKRRAVTAEEVAELTGVSLATVRAYIQALKAQGTITAVAKVETGKRGRPALRYARA